MDRHIASRVRQARMARGLTLRDMSEGLGLGHSQVEKYERAINKISCSRLHEIARLLSVDPGWFFEGFGPDEVAGVHYQRDVADLPQDMIELARAIEALPQSQRTLVRQMVKQLQATETGAEGSGSPGAAA